MLLINHNLKLELLEESKNIVNLHHTKHDQKVTHSFIHEREKGERERAGVKNQAIKLLLKI